MTSVRGDVCESPCRQLSTGHPMPSHSKVPEGSATCPRSHCQPGAQPGCLSPCRVAPGPAPPKLHQLPPPTTGAPAGCWGSTHPLLSAPLASSSGSAPGLRNPALDWGRTPCPGPAGRSSWGLAGALPTGRPSPCPSQVTVPGHWAPFPLDPEPSRRPMCLSGGVQPA